MKTEQDDTPDFIHYGDEDYEQIKAKLSLLQAVAALDEHFGYDWEPDKLSSPLWFCRGCHEKKGNPHADGCPVGRYEEGI